MNTGVEPSGLARLLQSTIHVQVGQNLGQIVSYRPHVGRWKILAETFLNKK